MVVLFNAEQDPARPLTFMCRSQNATVFSPLFYAERWQIIVLALELYRQFGVDMQVYYIQSALEEIRNLLEVYERLGRLRIEPWTLIELAKSGQRTLGYDPNTEMEWRNQASAHTDCLLNYK
ncbi:Protein F59C6.8, partial [Aphelenchoides avenae]